MTVVLRFVDLQDRGIVNSWPQLKRLQQLHGFPLGRMLSPNIRAWTESEIDEWLASRPIENVRPLRALLEPGMSAARLARPRDAKRTPGRWRRPGGTEGLHKQTRLRAFYK